jgi:hypothetical protein
VTKLVAFYVEKRNLRLPHSTLCGQTPDEMYFGTGGGIPDELAHEKAITKQKLSTRTDHSPAECATWRRMILRQRNHSDRSDAKGS